MSIFRCPMCYGALSMIATAFIAYHLQPGGWACFIWGLGCVGGACFMVAALEGDNA